MDVARSAPQGSHYRAARQWIAEYGNTNNSISACKLPKGISEQPTACQLLVNVRACTRLGPGFCSVWEGLTTKHVAIPFEVL